MKSLECRLDGTIQTREAALAEAELFATFCTLTEKEILHLRLLAEELLGMASGLLELRDGTFWILTERRHFELHLTARADICHAAQEKLVDASSSGKNEMHKGVSGKIRQAMQWLLEPQVNGAVVPLGVYNGMLPNVDQAWSLECYRESLPPAEKAQAWDELEKSVLGKLADDVQIGVKSNRVEIIIQKTFA